MTRARHHFRRPQLRRSTEDSVLAGVCGGIAEYTELPAWAIRLAFVIGQIAGFPTFIVYIVLALILKKGPEVPRDWREAPADSDIHEFTRGEALARAAEAYRALERRLQTLEDLVTKPGFAIDQELRRS